jgi:hypothetical protein
MVARLSADVFGHSRVGEAKHEDENVTKQVTKIIQSLRPFVFLVAVFVPSCTRWLSMGAHCVAYRYRFADTD